MTNYTNLPDSEKSKLKAIIKEKLKELYQKKDNRLNDDSILEKAVIAILQLAVAYKIIEEECLNNSCYINRVKDCITDFGSIDDITNKILMTFQTSPTVLEAVVEKALEQTAYEYNEISYNMEL